MAKLDRATIGLGSSIRDALTTIDKSGLQIALVVDSAGRLLGTVTDGDIRRGMLRGAAIDTPVRDIMNTKPKTVGPDSASTAIRNLMAEYKIHQIPVVGADGTLLDVALIDDLVDARPESVETTVVLMAGGLGARLRPLTDTLPKPMIPVGGRPILESIIGSFAEQGFSKFVLSVNYRAEMIQEHFGDGSRFNVDISYLHETERRGTAGSLALLDQPPHDPFIVMNGDLLTRVNFRTLLDFHTDHEASATMCVREYSFRVPYGVVTTAEHRIVSLVEKPTHSALVNAGIYVLEPSTLTHIPQGVPFDMPELFSALADADKTTTAFPIHEYWLDIGRIEDLERAQTEFGDIFV